MLKEAGPLDKNNPGFTEHLLDPRWRLSIPTQHRADIIKDNQVVLAAGYKGSLAIWNPDMWEKKGGRAGDVPPEERASFEDRFIAKVTHWIEKVDSQARVQLPDFLRDFCKLPRREVVVADAGDHILIWDRERWKEFLYQEFSRLEKSNKPPGP